MKKNILIVVAFLAFGFTNAQDVSFGIKGGLNLADLSASGSEPQPDLKNYTGFHIGGFVEIKLSDKIAVQPELLYSKQGAKFDAFVEQIGMSGDFTFKLDYINIPVMFKYYAAKSFSLEAGPQIGFLTAAKLKAEVASVGSVEDDVKEIFNSTDFDFNFGLGYDITDKFSANARYSLGLANIADTESGDDSKIKNNVFLVSLGYKF